MERPNILLITTDQQRFDTIAALAIALLTPHLDWLCDEVQPLPGPIATVLSACGGPPS